MLFYMRWSVEGHPEKATFQQTKKKAKEQVISTSVRYPKMEESKG